MILRCFGEGIAEEPPAAISLFAPLLIRKLTILSGRLRRILMIHKGHLQSKLAVCPDSNHQEGFSTPMGYWALRVPNPENDGHNSTILELSRTQTGTVERVTHICCSTSHTSFLWTDNLIIIRQLTFAFCQTCNGCLRCVTKNMMCSKAAPCSSNRNI